ncbi:adenylyl-sulfate kinase [Candidatus Woesearchaeota archaeon]|nr:adenylyl-sulfate kinase [Candidatus Woesearchaeota archaeon]
MKLNNTKKKTSKGLLIYIMGLPGTGKSTISKILCQMFDNQLGLEFELIDMDDIVKKMKNEDIPFSYTLKGRKRRYWFIATLAHERGKLGGNSIIAATAPLIEFRRYAKKLFKKNYFEIYLYCKKETYFKRDKKRTAQGKKSVYNKKRHVPGVDIPFENPFTSHLQINTDENSAEDSAKLILNFVKNSVDLTVL